MEVPTRPVKLVPSLRAALWLWYRGTHFRGWQRQSQRPTVQETVEERLRSCGITSGLAAAGRTDSGVHARQQVASLRVPLGTDVPGARRRPPGGRLGVRGREVGTARLSCAVVAQYQGVPLPALLRESASALGRVRLGGAPGRPRLAGAEASRRSAVAGAPSRARDARLLRLPRCVEQPPAAHPQPRGGAGQRREGCGRCGFGATGSAATGSGCWWGARCWWPPADSRRRPGARRWRTPCLFEGMRAPPRAHPLGRRLRRRASPSPAEPRPRLPDGPPFDGLGSR